MLVVSADEKGITTVDGEYVPFKRRTDYVACTNCFKTYSVRDLLVSSGEEPEEPVERLERLLLSGDADEEDPDES